MYLLKGTDAHVAGVSLSRYKAMNNSDKLLHHKRGTHAWDLTYYPYSLKMFVAESRSLLRIEAPDNSCSGTGKEPEKRREKPDNKHSGTVEKDAKIEQRNTGQQPFRESQEGSGYKNKEIPERKDSKITKT